MSAGKEKKSKINYSPLSLSTFKTNINRSCVWWLYQIDKPKDISWEKKKYYPQIKEIAFSRQQMSVSEEVQNILKPPKVYNQRRHDLTATYHLIMAILVRNTVAGCPITERLVI